MIRVKITHTLVGRTGKGKKEIDERSNSERLDAVLKMVKDQFGNRPLYILDGNLLIEENRRYPGFFAAGWFWGEGLDSAEKTSELVVVGHGSSLQDARKYLMDSMKNINWRGLAKDV